MALSRFCLDTSAYSRFMRGDSRLVALLDAAEGVGIPAIVVGELWSGFLGGSRLDQNVAELDALLANPWSRSWQSMPRSPVPTAKF